MTSHDDLRKLAIGATPGPWAERHWKGAPDDAVYSKLAANTENAWISNGSVDNCKFIAAANPQTVLGLLDEIERLRNVFAAAREWRFQVARRTFEPSLALEAAVDAAMTQAPFDTITDKLRAQYEFEHSRFLVANEDRDDLRQQLAAMTAARDEACRIAQYVAVMHGSHNDVDMTPTKERIAELREVGKVGK